MLSIGRFLFSVLLITLVGCASTNVSQHRKQSLSTLRDLPFNQHLFDHLPSAETTPEIDELIKLDPKVAQDFLNYYNKPELSNYTSIERVASYLGLLVDNLTYSDNTYTAQQTLDNQSGNCLSLTLLTTAIAKLVDVRVSYDLLDNELGYNLEQDVFVSANHMRAVLDEALQSGEHKNAINLKKRITIDYFDTQGMAYTGNVPVNYQLSLYYSNRAAELLLQKDLASAHAHAMKSLKISADNSSAINTMAILHRKMGKNQVAEAAYKAAIKSNARYTPLFYRNYIAFLQQQQRHEDADLVTAEYEKIKQQHPIEWIREGKQAYSQGDFAVAIKLYEKALNVAPELHEVYLLSAQASMAAGDFFAAQTQLRSALDANLSASEKGQYKGKLGKLKQHLN